MAVRPAAQTNKPATTVSMCIAAFDAAYAKKPVLRVNYALVGVLQSRVQGGRVHQARDRTAPKRTR